MTAIEIKNALFIAYFSGLLTWVIPVIISLIFMAILTQIDKVNEIKIANMFKKAGFDVKKND